MRHPTWWLPPFLRRMAWLGVLESVLDVPLKLPARGAVGVGTDPTLKWLIFDCPCGTGHRIQLPLSPGSTRWRIENRSPLTINPSVDSATERRRCHYLIRRGRIVWVPNRRK